MAKVRRSAAPRRAAVSAALALTLALPVTALAQAPAQGRGQAPGPGRGAAPTPRASAPVDLTGYWVSIVTEDWIERMAPDSPPSGVGRGGRGGAPDAAAGRGGAPAPPSNAGDRCRAYGAAGSLRVPGRVNITWVDDDTLKIDLDAGTQTRLLHFDPNAPPPAQPTLQGHSIAAWDTGARGRGGRGGPAAPPAWGSLRVVTTHMTPGYLLSSRSPYGANATLTEHFTHHRSFGVDYFTVTAVVEENGAQRVTSSTFKKEPNGSKFSPTGCEIVR